MSEDIVERLRARPYSKLEQDAADEIERLHRTLADFEKSERKRGLDLDRLRNRAQAAVAVVDAARDVVSQYPLIHTGEPPAWIRNINAALALYDKGGE